MLWFLILGALAVVLVVALAHAARHQPPGPVRPDCFRCGGPALALGAEAPRSYEVLACGACHAAWTLVHHVPSRLAYCPACQQRALDARCARASPAPGGLEVEVRERCHLCGHEATLTLVGAEPPPMGKVLHFPRPLKRR